jgi:DNA primase
VVIFAGGLDPADMVKNHQLEDLNKIFHSPKPLIENALEYIVSKFDIKNPIQKEEALKVTSSYLQTLSTILQYEYKGYLSAILGINERLVRVKRDHPLTESTKSEIKEDIAELNMIKTFLSKPEWIDKVGVSLFRIHVKEYKLLKDKVYDDPLLVAIDIRDDLRELSEEEFKNQLCRFLTRHNENGVLQIKRNLDLSLNKKSFYFRKINENLKKLRRGILVPYEDFGSII